MARFPNIDRNIRIKVMDVLAGYEGAAVMGNDSRNAADNRLFVEFYRKAVENPFKSNEAGRPVFDEVDFVKITVPGDRYSNFESKVTEEHKKRFAGRWERYKAGLTQAVTGTPLEQWPQMTVGMVASLKAMNVHTVEQLAEMSDQYAQQIMGNHDLRRKAKLFLDAAAGEAVNNKLQSELDKRDVEINQLKEQMAQLLAGQQQAKSAPKAATKE
jgi:hypothetical protein